MTQGVDIDAGNELVKRIAPVAKRTRRPEVLGGLGGFGALCELPTKYKNPVLVAGTDGVGTKLRPGHRPQTAMRKWASIWSPCALTT